MSCSTSFVSITQLGVGDVAKPAFTAQELIPDRFQLEVSALRIQPANLKQARTQIAG
jgi:hypothetical protein